MHKRDYLRKKTLTYPKLTGPIVTEKVTLFYPIIYMAQFFQVLLLMLIAIKIHKLTKKSGTNLTQHFVVLGAKLT